MTQMDEQMQQKMKQMLENMPRFDYKVIKFFEEKKELQKAIDNLYNNGFMNLVSRTLTDNFVKELYQLYVFMPKEGITTLISLTIGGIIGGILGWFHGNSIISLPLLNSVSAGGAIVTTVLCAGIGSILAATYQSILILFKPIKKVKPGMHMLTIYTDAERRKDLQDILNKLDTIKL